MPSMLLLAVDTSTQAGSLAVLRDDRVLGLVSTWVEETYSSRMFRHLEFLLRELALDLGHFDVFAVAAGPGSFTGLRVGLTAVKGWAEVYQKPIAAVSGLEAVAEQARAAEPLLVPVIDARRGQVYGGLYRRGPGGLERQGEESVMTPAEFLVVVAKQAAGEAVAFVTPAPEVLAGPLGASPFRNSLVEQVSTVLAPTIGQLGLKRARRGELLDALHLDANYIRRSDAELLWKGR
jgi:tRNA threonylcarbamoyladenosine biosynthesis protein TsaB